MMVGCMLYSAFDLTDGNYELLMRASDIPLKAVSICSESVMPQELPNAPASFNHMVTQLFPSHRAYVQTYLDDIFVHSRAEHGRSDVDNHIDLLRAVFECIRTNKRYATADKCIFGAEESPFLGCIIGKRGLRTDPAKVKAIVDWPVPVNLKDLRKWVGLAIGAATIHLMKKDAGYMDFVFGLPTDSEGNPGNVIFVDRLSKMAHLAVVPDTIEGKGTTMSFANMDSLRGTKLDMSTASHPQTDGQTERANRAVEEILRSVYDETPKHWRVMLPVVEYAVNNAVHTSTASPRSAVTFSHLHASRWRSRAVILGLMVEKPND
ncbi:LOW QUALITY PROTEIN: RxLR effector candidate protein [Phytophthora palmivora]|uniref:RxLR effector candidate protein n=1 Tax=Phytophthora palmivora TaxID=4796 RepID=A0A2P4Y099_9STRA|nr:LOW QUALITY PROTEIN: RxLR effector candidate protein [Phytophthora palmivora]